MGRRSTCEDAWLKEDPLIKKKEFKQGATQALKHQGSIIDQYFNKDSKTWQIHRPTKGKIVNQLKQLLKGLNKSKIKLNDQEGKPILKSTYDGKYRVKEVLITLSNITTKSEGNRIWENIQKAKLTPRIAFFLWMVVRKRLLTIDNLQRRGFSMVNRC